MGKRRPGLLDFTREDSVRGAASRDYLTIATSTPKQWLREAFGLTGEAALSAWCGHADWYNAHWRRWEREARATPAPVQPSDGKGEG